MKATVSLFSGGQWISAEIIAKKGIILRTTTDGIEAIVKSPSALFVRSFEAAIVSQAPVKMRVESDFSDPFQSAVRCVSISVGPETRLEFATA